MLLSGPEWAQRFPQTSHVGDLAEPFRTNASRFVSALRRAGASVMISDTLRRPQRVYLIHYAFAIARHGLHPARVPCLPGLDIQWLHKSSSGQPDLAASRAAAEQMVRAFGLRFPYLLHSRHNNGLAIDMFISWQRDLEITKADGSTSTIASLPREGAHNTHLHEIGAEYGVLKLLGDEPHWSVDGH